GTVYRAVFSPDGRALLTASEDGTARLWALGAAEAGLATKPDLLPPIREAASPRGTYRVAADAETGRTARVRAADGGATGGRVLTHGSRINAVAFSPDEAHVVTASDDNTARVWDARTGAPVTPPLPHNGSVERAGFGADGGW